MNEMRSYRDESCRNWAVPKSVTPTVEQINCGSLMRIADATEKMAQRYTELIRERDHYKGRAENLDAECNRLSRRIIALRGVITRMKKVKEKSV